MPTPTPTTRHRTSRRPTRPRLASRPRSLSPVRSLPVLPFFFGPTGPRALIKKNPFFSPKNSRCFGVVPRRQLSLVRPHRPLARDGRDRRSAVVRQRRDQRARSARDELRGGLGGPTCVFVARRREATGCLRARLGTFVFTRLLLFFCFSSPCSFRSRLPATIPTRTIPPVRNAATPLPRNPRRNYWREGLTRYALLSILILGRRRDPLRVRAQVRDHLQTAAELDRVGLELDRRRRQLADEDRATRRGRLSGRVAQDGIVTLRSAKSQIRHHSRLAACPSAYSYS